MGKIRDRIKTLAVIDAKIELETWEEIHYYMEGVLEDIEDEHTTGIELRKMKGTKSRIGELERKIKEIEELCNTLK